MGREGVVALLGNEWEYGCRSGMWLLDPKRHGDGYELTVADRGKGVKYPKKIFRRFYRASDDPSIKGTGLGLAIVKNIVESNGGSVSAGNREEGGFILKIKMKVHRKKQPEENGIKHGKNAEKHAETGENLQK